MTKTHKKMATAGTVMAPPSKKNAPGSTCSVAMYTEAYSGVYRSGTIALITPNSEFTLPI